VANRLAIKKLTASDCTLFEAVFRKINAGNQKSINLNADVLTGELYPSLDLVAAASEHGIPMHLSVYGPGAKGVHKLARKIIKNATYKNWRLNGEFILGPPEDPNRYDDIKPGDLAILVFKGEPVPSAIDLVILSQSNADDAPIHAALEPRLSRHSMISFSAGELATIASDLGIPEAHPVFIAATVPELEAALEDAAQGGLEGVRKLLKSKGKRKITGSDLAKAKEKADRVGREGEGLVNGYLMSLLDEGILSGVVWTSNDNAIAPYDFEITKKVDGKTLIDVKSTEGPFLNSLHISMAEIIEASECEDYRIYRVSDLNEDGGTLTISRNIVPLAKKIKKIHEDNFPNGIRVDSFSLSPSVIDWDTPIVLVRRDESGEEVAWTGEVSGPEPIGAEDAIPSPT